MLFLLSLFFLPSAYSDQQASQHWESPNREYVFVKNRKTREFALTSRVSGSVFGKFDKRLRYVRWNGNSKFIGIYADFSHPWEMEGAATFIYELESKKTVKFSKDPYCGGAMIAFYGDMVTFDCKLSAAHWKGPKIFFKNYNREKFFSGKLEEVSNDNKPRVRSVRKVEMDGDYWNEKKKNGWLIQFDQIGNGRKCIFADGSERSISYYSWEVRNFFDEGYFYCRLFLENTAKQFPEFSLKDSSGKTTAVIELNDFKVIDSIAWGESSTISRKRLDSGMVLPLGAGGLLSKYKIKSLRPDVGGSKMSHIRMVVDTEIISSSIALESLPLRLRHFSWGSGWTNISLLIPTSKSKDKVKAVRYDGEREYFVRPVGSGEGYIEIPLEDLDRSTYYLVNADYKLGSQLPR